MATKCRGGWAGSFTLSAALVAVVGMGTGALAHVDPPNCTANALTFTTSRAPGVGPDGTITTWNVTVNGQGAGACNNTRINVDFCCPGPTATVLDPATAPACNPADPVHENCCFALLNPTSCMTDAECTAATPAGAPPQSCLADPNAAGGKSCGYPGNTPPAGTGFLSTQCRINANPGVASVTGGIVGSSVLHDTEDVDSTADLRRTQGFSVQPCAVQVDKQVCCKPAAQCADGDFADVGYNDNVVQSCNGLTGANVTVRYKIRNPNLFRLFGCTVDDSNTVITTVNAGTVDPFDDPTFPAHEGECSAAFAGGEPDMATVSCFCTPALDPNFTATDTDTASFACLTPSVEVTKTCGPQAACGNPIEATVRNTGDVNLVGCDLTDLIHAGAPSGGVCSGPGTPVLLSPDPIAGPIAPNATATATGTAMNLLTDSCNAVSVTCGVEGFPGVTVSDDAPAVLCDVPRPDVAIDKVCEDQSGGSNLIRIQVSNPAATSEVGIQDCRVVDEIFPNQATCGTVGTGTAVPLANNGALGPIAEGASTMLTANFNGLTANTCNRAAVVECSSQACPLVKTSAPADTAECRAFLPKITISKECVDQAAGVNQVDITITNTGNEPLSSCTVTDEVFKAAAPVCSGASVPSDSAPALISGSFPLAPNAQVVYRTTVTGLTAPVTCDRATATCTGANSASTTGPVSGTDECRAFQPAIMVSKECADQVGGVNQVDITVTNTGNEPLSGCTVTDEVFKANAPACSGASVPSDSAPTLVSGSFPLASNAQVVYRTTVTGLTAPITCDRATVDCTGANSTTATGPVSGTDECRAPNPRVEITKTCAPQTSCGNAIEATVRNTGNVNLVNCDLTDLIHAGAPSGAVCSGTGTPVALSPDPIAGPIAPNGTATATGTAMNLLADSCNAVSVTCGVEGFPGLTATDEAPVVLCDVPQPDVAIDKVCEPQSGGTNVIRITVSNPAATSEVGIRDCRVIDEIFPNQASCGAVGTGTPVPLANNGALAPIAEGASATVMANFNGLTSDTCDRARVVECSSQACPAVKTLAREDTAQCAAFQPRMTISKECADQVAGVNQVDITVTNTGNEPLSSCTVTDEVFKAAAPACSGTSVPSDSTPLLISGSFPLAVNAQAVFRTTVTGLTDPVTCDRATANCTGANSGSTTGPLPGTDECRAFMPDIRIEKECDESGGITVTVENTGNEDLTGCEVTDSLFVNSAQCAGTGTDVPLSPAGAFDLARGASKVFTADVSTLITSDSCDRATVMSCKGSGSGETILPKNALAVCPVQLGGCRVTGGGKLFDTSPAIKDVTHGGQVGASLSVPTPFTEDSECIKGEWQHTRHVKAGLSGDFHARSFDSLMCSCLGCLEDDGITPCDPAAGECPVDPIIGGLCHPEQPNQNFKENRVCGPEPRKAPANKMCFSGVGDFVATQGKKDRRSVVFRVDIIDRSEPGAQKEDPPDRYRIRIWLLNGTDAGTPAALDLREAIACADPTTEVLPTTLPHSGNATPAPSIDDGGDMNTGNHQLHPPTGATCSATP